MGLRSVVIYPPSAFSHWIVTPMIRIGSSPFSLSGFSEHSLAAVHSHSYRAMSSRQSLSLRATVIPYSD